jgi:hypothetical protein
VRAGVCGRRAAGFALRAAGFALRAAGFALRAAGFALRAAGFALRAAGFALRAARVARDGRRHLGWLHENGAVESDESAIAVLCPVFVHSAAMRLQCPAGSVRAGRWPWMTRSSLLNETRQDVDRG